jgi:hypothetical protein
MIALMLAAQLIAVADPAPREPTPDFPVFRAIAEAGIRDRLNDPDSAKFKWDPETFTLGPKFPGATFACGMLNARNRFGGYDGYHWFWVEEKGGVMVLYQLDSDDDDDALSTSGEKACRKWGFDGVPATAPALP